MTSEECCCDEEDPPDDPDGPIIDSGCCESHNPRLDFQFNCELRLAWRRRARFECSDEVNQGSVVAFLNGILSWDLVDDVMTWTGSSTWTSIWRCNWTCPGVDCEGDDCYESCPCGAELRVDGSEEFNPLVELRLIQGPIGEQFGLPWQQCIPQDERDDEDACWFVLSYRLEAGRVGPSCDYVFTTSCDEPSSGWPYEQGGQTESKRYVGSGVTVFKIDRDQSGFCSIGDKFEIFGMSSQPLDFGPSLPVLDPYIDETGLCFPPSSFSRSWSDRYDDPNGCSFSLIEGEDQVTLDLDIVGNWYE